MRRLVLVLVFLLPLLLLAQQEFADPPVVPGDLPGFWTDSDTSDSLQYNAGGVVGAVTVDGITYSQIRFRPELNFGKVGICLDLDFLIDGDGRFRQQDWENFKDYVGKLFYLRYGRRNDFFYMKTGCISDYTLGHGLIFNNFSNTLYYPEEKNIGTYIGINTDISDLGGELYTHDLFRNQILAGKVYAKPFQHLNAPWLQELRMGINMGWDRNQLARFPDTDGDGVPDIYDKFPKNPNLAADTDNDGIPDEEDWDINGNGFIDGPSNPAVDATFPGIHDYYPSYPFDNDYQQDYLFRYKKRKSVLIFSMDYELPLVDDDDFKLSHYAEMAKIRSHGAGFVFPGFGAKYSVFEAKLEFRRFERGFLPSFFDRTYEGKRSELKVELRESTPDDSTRSGRVYWLSTKDEVLATINPTMGWFGYLQADLSEILVLKMAYQDMYGKDMKAGKSLWFKASLNPKFIPKFKQANFYYSQVNANYLDFRHPRNVNAQVVGELIYSIAPNANLIGKYTEHYTDINNDGRIKGKKEVKEILSFGVEFIF